MSREHLIRCVIKVAVISKHPSGLTPGDDVQAWIVSTQELLKSCACETCSCIFQYLGFPNGEQAGQRCYRHICTIIYGDNNQRGPSYIDWYSYIELPVIILSAPIFTDLHESSNASIRQQHFQTSDRSGSRNWNVRDSLCFLWHYYRKVILVQIANIQVTSVDLQAFSHGR